MSNQDKIQELTKTLTKTNLFENVYIYENLEDQCFLRVEYKPNSNLSIKEFNREKSELEKLITKLIEINYPQIIKNCYGPNENEIYKADFKCLVSENNLVEKFVNDLKAKIIKSYLFIKGIN